MPARKTATDLLTAAETIRELEVSRTTLTNLIHRGDIVPANPPNPALRRQARLLFRRTDVDHVRRYGSMRVKARAS